MRRAVTSIPEAMNTPADLLDELALAYQPLATEPITRPDAAEIADNLRRFFDVLQDWAVEDAARGVGPWVDRPELQ